MRIYIIGNDAITLCREPPATVDTGEIAVSSNEELHAVRLSGKRLLALWNALPGIEKRTKVGDRETLIDQLWSAVEALPDPDQQSAAKRPSKQDAVISMLQLPEGATVDEATTFTAPPGGGRALPARTAPDRLAAARRAAGPLHQPQQRFCAGQAIRGGIPIISPSSEIAALTSPHSVSDEVANAGNAEFGGELRGVHRS